ncbi:LAFA_0C01002g1_1 [Lachancea sp. 'fantastica']|nr:LAFA_0C01002g1_1 [Lachancea sp. 'fantastica']
MSNGDLGMATGTGYGLADDEPENYDDFMISDDEVDAEIEMDDASDDSFEQPSDPAKPHTSNVYGNLVSAAQDLVEQKRFNEAGQVLAKAALQPQAHATFAAALQIVRCRYHMWAGGLSSLPIDTIGFTPVQEAIDNLEGALDLDPIHNNQQFSFQDLVNEIAPPLNSIFVLDPSWHENRVPISCSRLFLTHCKLLGNQLIPNLWRSRMLQYEIAVMRLSIDDTVAAERVLVEELYQSSQDQLSNLEFLLAWFISTTLNDTKAEEAAICEELVSRSFSLLQKSLTRPLSMMAILHFTQAYLSLDQLSTSNKKLTLHCNAKFWESFKCLEELGNKTSFRDLVLCAFILTSLLQLGQKTQLDDVISPFELEQIKILESQFTRHLEELYQAFVDYNLDDFAIALAATQQSTFSHVLRPLFPSVVRLLQVRMLWHRLAVCYSCISLSDIQGLLKVGELPELTRNSILTILMQSIMDDTAPVFFKLDLTQDLVYFGDEVRGPLTSYTRDTYLSTRDPNGQQSGLHALGHGESAAIPVDEWLGSIGIFNLPPRRLKGLRPLKLLQELKHAREMSPAVSDSPSRNAQLKFSEMAAHVREVLQ